MVKNPLAKAGDVGSTPGSGRSPGEGNGNPLPYSCLENPMDRGAWWAIVHEVSKSWTIAILTELPNTFTFTYNGLNIFSICGNLIYVFLKDCLTKHL